VYKAVQELLAQLAQVEHKAYKAQLDQLEQPDLQEPLV
jgi:hypothetical protein